MARRAERSPARAGFPAGFVDAAGAALGNFAGASLGDRWAGPA
jgi:hypothetical protein